MTSPQKPREFDERAADKEYFERSFNTLFGIKKDTGENAKMSFTEGARWQFEQDSKAYAQLLADAEVLVKQLRRIAIAKVCQMPDYEQGCRVELYARDALAQWERRDSNLQTEQLTNNKE